MPAKIIWVTPEADTLIGWMARVSNPKAKKGDPTQRLIQHLLDNKHWSPLEMASACVEIETTRDIARQILRHRSFHFQEFSQRYAEVEQDQPITCTARLQDHKNRQNSLATDDPAISDAWNYWVNRVWDCCWLAYKACLSMGIAKEVARKLLPEGLTKTTMFMSGTVRDWVHYLALRTKWDTQLEHREIAQSILELLEVQISETFAAARKTGAFDDTGPARTETVKSSKVEPIDYGNV